MTDRPAKRATRRLLLLGATGSIGAQTVQVVRALAEQAARDGRPAPLDVVGLAAGSNATALADLAEDLGVTELALARNGDHAFAPGANVRTGDDAAERLVREVDADIVLGAMVGAAGLPATLAALDLGRDVALANKETLVAAGAIVVERARRTGARLLPVDSEHSGLWQCLPAAPAPPCALHERVRRLTLTASGGPFLGRDPREVYDATPEQALAHPTWSMGAKVTVDCASLTNKALELIEAHWLFGVPADRLGVLIHPQSIVHALVEMTDGSVIAQMGTTDMRTPIQVALTWPERAPATAPRLDLAQVGSLEFREADTERYPALALARRAIETGGVAGAVLNAANEAAVEAFLAHRVPFGRVVELTGETVDALVASKPQSPPRDLDEVMEADREARRFVADRLAAAV